MPGISDILYHNAAVAGVPLGGTFELTPLCNMNCKMCYIRMSPDEIRKQGKMKSADEWLTLAEEAKKQGMLFLLLTGGEPFMYLEFWKLYYGLKKMGFFISINSNGTLLEGETLDRLIEAPPYRINITLYGSSDKTYTSLCGKPDGYTRVTRAIQTLKEHGIFVKINGSITPFNCQDIEDNLNYAKEINVPIQMEAYMFPPVRRNNKQTGRFDPVEAGKYQAKIERLKFPDKNFDEALSPLSECDVTAIINNKFRCRAGKCAFWVNWKGEMTPCGMMEHFTQYPFETGFTESWNNIKKAIAEAEVLKGCNNCSERSVCKVCPAVALAETGSFNKKPEYFCEMTKSLLSELRTQKPEEKG